MNAHMIAALVLVVLTVLAVFGLGWEARAQWDGRQAEADPPVPYRMKLLGCMETSPFYGRSDPSFELPGRGGQLERVDRLALLDDAITYAERHVRTREAAAEVDAIWAEVEANPDQWRHR